MTEPESVLAPGPKEFPYLDHKDINLFFTVLIPLPLNLHSTFRSFNFPPISSESPNSLASPAGLVSTPFMDEDN